MKNVIVILALFTLMLNVGCKKEELPTPVTHVANCSNNIDSVNVRIYLVNFVTEVFDSLPPATNSNEFVSPYVITKSQGVTLDSIVLDVDARDIQFIDNTFSFEKILGGWQNVMPTEIEGLKIDRFHDTTLELWSNNMLITTFSIDNDGFYGVYENFAGATAYYHPVQNSEFWALVRM